MILQETKTRLKSKSPKYFVKLRNLAVIIGGSAGSIWAANEMLNLTLDPWAIKILKWTIAVCVGIAGTSILTKKDSLSLDTNQESNQNVG